MRDLLPVEARARRVLMQQVLTHFELWGYELVGLPAFELARVLERGLGPREADDVLRFVEPESGEIALLRPDMTPQIARIVATRLAGAPQPLRLCYEGSIVRRKQGRARRHRQIPQVGVELVGLSSTRGEQEILELLCSSLRATGLSDFLVDIGHASIPRSLMQGLPVELVRELTESLSEKNFDRLEQLVRGAPGHVDAPTRAALGALAGLSGGGPSDPGGRAVLQRARELLTPTAAAGALRELEELWEAVQPEHGEVLRIDMGEPRGLEYYTGPIFHALAEGPGEPIATGGRYDDLLSRFDAPLPAVGFALSLDALSWARNRAGVVDAVPARVLVALRNAASEVTAMLRERGIVAVACDESGGMECFAGSWSYSHVLTERPGDDGALVVLSERAVPRAPRAHAFVEVSSTSVSASVQDISSWAYACINEDQGRRTAEFGG